ncbi:MAG: EamA family transporter [Myxococcota bacterium]
MALVLGLTTAFAYGTADLLARYSTRRLGVMRALVGTLLAGSFALTIWLLIARIDVQRLLAGWQWLVLPGVLNFFMLGLLYAALERGPISVASPVVAIHPALVVLCLLAVGVHPTAQEVIGSVVILAGGLLLATQVERVAEGQSLPAGYAKKTAILAAACAFVLALQILSVQQAARTLGALPAAWGSRVFAFVCALVVLSLSRSASRWTRAGFGLTWVQGLLDVAAVTALAYGSGDDSARTIVPVVGSAFSAVTVLLARVVLKEAMTMLQWLSIAVLLCGIVVLGWP